MQNFPLMDISQSSGDLLPGMNSSRFGGGEFNDGFRDVFQDALQSPQNNKSPLPSDYNPLPDAGEGRHEQELSREEFAGVKDFLRQQGVSEQEIKNLEESFNESGLTWSELGDELGLDQEMTEMLMQAVKNASREGDSRKYESAGLRLDQKISEEDMDAVKTMLREQGISEQKIQKLKDSFQESGLTWSELGDELGLDREMTEMLMQSVKQEGWGSEDLMSGEMDDMWDEKITPEELDAIKEMLLEQGIDSSELQKLQEKVDNSELSWRELVSRLDMADSHPPMELSSGQRQDLVSFLSELGFNAQERKDLIRDVEQGRLDRVAEQLASRLDKMEDGQRVSLSRSQLESLLQGFRAQSRDRSEYSAFADKELGRSDLKNLLGMIRQDSRESRADGLLQGLKNAAGDSGSRLSREENSLLRMIEAAKEEGKGRSAERGNASANPEAEKKLKDTREKSERSQSMHSGRENSERSEGSKSSRENQDSRNERSGYSAVKDSQELRDQALSGEASRDGGRDSGSNNQDPWEKFLSRVRSDTSQEVRTAAAAAGAREASEAARQGGQAAQREQISQQVMEQVRSGTFKDMGQGKSKMTLQLNPPNLGMLSVVLKMQGSEVRAMVSTSNHEVAQVINDNLPQLRSSLEQQGLRVGKIDVHTQQPDNQPGSWQGREEHNKARDRMKKAMEKARLREMEQEGKGLFKPQKQETVFGKNMSSTGLSIFA
ncbi:flagellar hook-length control protein [Desulfonatronospira thiodismutans ASO3-1]|uniref:Flagellar hook-length control protein n=2 Tax=Desulfonatronospira TaxID=488937 RepID=D6SRH4_9BACT|nr:flagellar hook-length control protein FliK [Desulfonatronospira thiodismutans]EFI33290.1 flagellar hook-length control protein [Desulfonatronospira thiodismutans ASO3-1]